MPVAGGPLLRLIRLQELWHARLMCSEPVEWQRQSSRFSESLPAHLSPLLQPADVWLLRLPPHPQPSALNVDAWSLTCALALHSIERGHAYLYSQRRLVDAETRASNRAVGWLSYLLSDVASSAQSHNPGRISPPTSPASAASRPPVTAPCPPQGF